MRVFLLSLFFVVAFNTYSRAQMNFGFGVAPNYGGNITGNAWVTGCYYDVSGKKTIGFLSNYYSTVATFYNPKDYFFYKKDIGADKIKIFMKTIKCIVANKDSFIVSNSHALDDTRFMEVVLDNSTKLYATWIEAGSSTLYRYYYGSNPDSTTQLTRKNFIVVMSQIMADKPEVVEKIQKKNYRYGELEDLLVYYRTGKEPR